MSNTRKKVFCNLIDIANKNLNLALISLTTEMSEQYEKLDFMYKGDLTVENIQDSVYRYGYSIFCGQFYVTITDEYVE